MMTVDSPLLIEGLFADIAHFCICELLASFEFEAWHIFYVGGYLW
jgi:hypothetical protein